MTQIIDGHAESKGGCVYKTLGWIRRCAPLPSSSVAVAGAALLAVMSSLAAVARADFVCSSEMAYKWARNQREVSSAAKDDKAASAGGDKVEPSVVKLMAVERPGIDENAAKEALQAEVSRQRPRISALCKKEHESFGDCVAGKLSNKSSMLNSLSFSVREEVQRGLINECKEQSGTCLSVEVSEPKCREVVVVKPAEAAGDGKKDAKKGDGKKK